MPLEEVKKHRIDRSNLVAEDTEANANNWGHGITATLTENLFQKSFGSWSQELKLFDAFMWAPRTVIGKGIKNIQWGLKNARQYKPYSVGDLINVFIDNRPKVYESRIGDLFIKLQCSLDLPPHWHVDKFINPVEYAQFIADYKSRLVESMSFTVYNLIRVMFLSSAFEMCMPDDKYQRFLLATLLKPNPPGVGTWNPKPTLDIIHTHANVIKALCDELAGKITNRYVFDVLTFIPSKPEYKPWKYDIPWKREENDKIKLLQETLLNASADPERVDNKTPTNTRAQSLRAFELTLSSILEDIIFGLPKSRWWQGNKGNIYPESIWKEATANNQRPTNPYRNVDPQTPSTRLLDKKFNERPVLHVKASKEDLVLVMALTDYLDFTSGRYTGFFGSDEMAGINFDASVASKVSQIIPIPGMVPGHAIIMDKRLFAIVPHLTRSGRDTVNQRLVQVETLHQWFICGMFDQFVGVRIQMVNFATNGVDETHIFFDARNAEQ